MSKLTSKPTKPDTTTPDCRDSAAAAPRGIKPPALVSPVALKDDREHLRATQRAKKAADRAKGRKGGAGRREREGAAETREPGTTEIVSFWSEVWAGGRDEEWEHPKAVDITGPWLRQERAGREVVLADLIRPAKAQRPRKGQESDFEVVPHVRSVIVLDEHGSMESELDEPWEYVSRAEDGSKKAVSYAQIVAHAK